MKMTAIKRLKLPQNYQDKKKKNNFGSLKRSKFVKLIVLILIVILFCLLIFLGNNLLKVKEVKIVPETLPCTNKNKISQRASLVGQNILFINQMQLERNIKNKFLCIESINLTRTFPNKIQIDLTMRQAGAIIKVLSPRTLEKIDFIEATPSSSSANVDFSITDASLEAEFLADINNFIFAKMTDENLGNFYNINSLPNIYSENIPVAMGEFYKNRLVQSVYEISDKLKKISLSINLIKISDEKLLISSEPKIILALNKDILKQLASLQLILQKAKIDSRPIELIDLRFDKPVVIYSSKKN